MDVQRVPGTAATSSARVLVYAPGLWEDWVEGELAGGAIVQSCRTFAMAVAALLDDPPPRAQMLVVDFDALTALDLVALCGLRERGWFGAVVAIGDVDQGLAYAASITHVLRPPCKTGALRAALEVGTRHDEVTTPIPCLPY